MSDAVVSPACCAAPDAASASKCVLCQKAVCARCWSLLNGKQACAACRDSVLAEIARESAIDANLPLAAAAGVAAAAACGALWAAMVVATGSEIGFAAVGVGWAVAQAVRRTAGGKRGVALQRISLACAALGLLFGKYFTIAHMLRAMIARDPAAAGKVPGYFDPRVASFVAGVLPRVLNPFDLLWLLLALATAWRLLRPARVVVADGRRDAAPKA